MYRRFFKRALDIVLTSLALIVLSPAILTVFILVRIKLGSPAVFAQARPGKDGKLFTLYKFRSMTDERDENGELKSDAERTPRFGERLRSLSLDELPELINILKGDMSIIGPRPLLVEYLPLYSNEQARRHEVRPGLSGWAQVHGRNCIDWDERLKLDVWYVDNMSFLLDVKILFMTVALVVKRDGINQSDGVTMQRFTGSGTKN